MHMTIPNMGGCRTLPHPPVAASLLVGYAFKTRGYRVWLLEINQIIESSNVSFDESRCGPGCSGAALGTENYDLFPHDGRLNPESTGEVASGVFPDPSGELPRDGDEVEGS